MQTLLSKGFILRKFGAVETAFQLEEIELKFGDNQLLVEVTSFGLNYADIMARLGKYRETPPLPTTIGYEVVGKVVQVGENLDTSLIGKRVLAFSQFGGYAQHAVIEKDAFVILEDTIADGDALALCTQYTTAYFMASYQSQIRSHDIVLIHAAAGGVGLGLVQLCKNSGATVIAKIGDSQKAARLKELGVDCIVNYKESDYEKQVEDFLKGRKISCSFNPVAGTTFKKDMRLLGNNGKLVLFGGAELSDGKYGILSQINFLRKMGRVIPIFLMMQSKSVLGVNMLKIALQHPLILKECMEKVVEAHQQGNLKTYIDSVFSATELTEAHRRLESGRSSGKIIVQWDKKR